VVRYMFFSAEDTKWFMSVKLRTEFGLIGQIRETLGTKGHFRCAFSDFIKADRHDLHAPVQATVPPPVGARVLGMKDIHSHIRVRLFCIAATSISNYCIFIYV
jgi:hypothetical protein